jgi:molybdenum cofactor synthesis domain-containing protein
MIRSAIITISDSTVAGTREDRSGPALEAKLAELGWTVSNKLVLPDEEENIARVLEELADSDQLDLILTTGGTGLAPRDVTPEATKRVSDREIPGFGELMRAEGLKTTKFAPLSRGGAATRGTTLILNVPGSPKGAVESLMAVAHLVPHVVDLLHGRTEHK